MDNPPEENAIQEKKEKYLLLDFNGKVTNDLLQNEFFLRIANLHKINPLVQINDMVFKGNYDNAVGTNLFFEILQDAHPLHDVFEKRAPIRVNHILTESKILNLRPVKVPPKKIALPINKNKHIECSLDWDYHTLLEKFENGTLKIEDITTTEINFESEELETIVQQNNDIKVMQIERHDIEEEQKLHEDFKSTTAVKILEEDYQKLKLLSGRPVRRHVAEELIEDCEPQFKQSYEYHNIERQILQPSDAFRNESISDIDEDTLANCVDIDRCIIYGILSSSNEYPRKLSKHEKEKILTIENFDYLSLSARYCVLANHIAYMEAFLRSASDTSTKDEYGRTPLETLEIYKKLESALKKRLGEIKSSL